MLESYSGYYAENNDQRRRYFGQLQEKIGADNSSNVKEVVFQRFKQQVGSSDKHPATYRIDALQGGPNRTVFFEFVPKFNNKKNQKGAWQKYSSSGDKTAHYDPCYPIIPHGKAPNIGAYGKGGAGNTLGNRITC